VTIWLSFEPEELVDRSTLAESDSVSLYRRAQDLDGSSSPAPERLSPGASLIIIAVLSLGVWWALWLAVSHLVLLL
jgi:hypothetical protein